MSKYSIVQCKTAKHPCKICGRQINIKRAMCAKCKEVKSKSVSGWGLNLRHHNKVMTGILKEMEK